MRPRGDMGEREGRNTCISCRSSDKGLESIGNETTSSMLSEIANDALGLIEVAENVLQRNKNG